MKIREDITIPRLFAGMEPVYFRNRTASKLGVAFVELAIVLPFILAVMAIGWDTLVSQVAKINHRKAAIAVAKDFKPAPLNAQYALVNGNPTVQLNRLTLQAATSQNPVGGHPKGFLPMLVDSFNNQLENSGSGASAFKSTTIVDLKYLQICEDSGNLGCTSAAKSAGAALSSVSVENGDGSEEFYMGDKDDECLGDERDRAIEQLKILREEKLTELLSYKGDADLHVGILLVDVDTGHPTLDRITAYAPWRSVVFWLQCTRPPYIFRSDPVITTGVLFPDTEAAYVG